MRKLNFSYMHSLFFVKLLKYEISRNKRMNFRHMTHIYWSKSRGRRFCYNIFASNISLSTEYCIFIYNMVCTIAMHQFYFFFVTFYISYRKKMSKRQQQNHTPIILTSILQIKWLRQTNVEN